MPAAHVGKTASVAHSILLDTDYYPDVDQSRVNQALHKAVVDRYAAVTGLRRNASDELAALRSASDKAATIAADGLDLFLSEVGASVAGQFDDAAVSAAAQLSLDPTFFAQYTGANARVKESFERLMHPPASAESPLATEASGAENANTDGAPASPKMDGSATLTLHRDVSPVSSGVGHALPPLLAELRSDRTRLTRKQELMQELRGWRDEVLPLGDEGAVESTLTVCDLELADPLRVLRAELQKLNGPLAGLDATMRATAEERNAALRAEELATAETLSTNAFTQHQEMLAQVRQRVNLATDAFADVDDFLIQVTESKVALEQLDKAKQRTDVLIKTCVADRDRLEKYHDTLTATATREKAAYDEGRDARANQLRSLAQDESSVWSDMAALLVKLEAIHDRRDEVITNHLTAAEQEQNRRSLLRAQQRAVFEQAARLDALRASLRGAEELILSLTESCEKSYSTIEKRAWPRKQNDIVVKECIRYHDSYLQFVCFAGDLVNRTEQRKANFNRMLRSVEFQVKTAADMLDADLPVYREQQRRYAAAVDAIEEKLQSYKTVVAEQTEHWRPIETCLDDNDIDFTPPDLALQELQRDLTKAHVEAVDSLTNEEQNMLEQEKRAARNMANLVDATKASLEEKRITKSAVRQQNSTPGTTPTKASASATPSKQEADNTARRL